MKNSDSNQLCPATASIFGQPPGAMTISMLTTGIVLAYPFVSYALQKNNYGSLLPAMLALVIGWRALSVNEAFRRNSLFVIAGLILIGAVFVGSMTSQLVPVMIYSVLAWFFGRTLFCPPSLIERFVKLQFSDIPKEVLDYCRQLTAVWAGLFVAIVIVSVTFMLTGHDWYLTLFHGVIVWLLMAVLALAEHLYRLRRFPFMKDQMPSIRETFQSAIKSKDQLW